jgi:hypothetical protein
MKVKIRDYNANLKNMRPVTKCPHTPQKIKKINIGIIWAVAKCLLQKTVRIVNFSGYFTKDLSTCLNLNSA